MQQLMENTEQLTIQESAENNRSKNYSLIERKEIEGTPFVEIINNETKKKFLAMGDYRMTPEFDLDYEFGIWLKENHWLMVTTISSIAAEKVFQMQLNLQTQGTNHNS